MQAFNDPIKALKYFNSVNSPQLLITDIRMPGLAGFELARRVKKDHPDISIMSLTFFEINKAEFDKLFTSIKIDALVNKPLGIGRLVDMVNAVLVNNTPKDSSFSTR